MVWILWYKGHPVKNNVLIMTQFLDNWTHILCSFVLSDKTQEIQCVTFGYGYDHMDHSNLQKDWQDICKDWNRPHRVGTKVLEIKIL